jgi:hypothetical protein
MDKMIAKALAGEDEDDSSEADPRIPLNPYYLYTPKIDIDLEINLIPRVKRRSQGVSRADGYYWHNNPAAAGLYWVLKAIASMDKDKRYPQKYISMRLHRDHTLLIHTLAENMTWAIRSHAFRVFARVRHEETSYLIEELLSKKCTKSKSVAADFAKAEAALSAYMRNGLDPRNERNAHMYWLSHEKEASLKKLIESSELDVAAPYTASKHMRNMIHKEFFMCVENAAKKAIEYSRIHKDQKPFSIQENKELCRIRPDYCITESKMVTGGNLHDSTPKWAHKYIENLSQVWGSDELAWEKSIFRLTEPMIRLEDFARKMKEKNAFSPSAAFSRWTDTDGRYYGMVNTKTTGLLKAMDSLDHRAVELLSTLKLNPPTKGASKNPISKLEHFSRYAQSREI